MSVLGGVAGLATVFVVGIIPLVLANPELRESDLEPVVVEESEITQDLVEAQIVVEEEPEIEEEEDSIDEVVVEESTPETKEDFSASIVPIVSPTPVATPQTNTQPQSTPQSTVEPPAEQIVDTVRQDSEPVAQPQTVVPAPAPTPTPTPAPVVTQQPSTPAPAPVQGGVVKKSVNDICHSPGSTYYSRTKNFTPYNTMEACLASGGRLPLR